MKKDMKKDIKKGRQTEAQKKQTKRYLWVSAFQLAFLPVLTLLQQLAVRNEALMAHILQINELWPQKYPLTRLATSSVIFFALMTWASLHFQRKNAKYQSKEDKIYPMIPVETSLVLLGYTTFVSYMSPESVLAYHYIVLLLALVMVIEIIKVANYMVSCPNETTQPTLKNQKPKSSPKSGKASKDQGPAFVKRSKKK